MPILTTTSLLFFIFLGVIFWIIKKSMQGRNELRREQIKALKRGKVKVILKGKMKDLK